MPYNLFLDDVRDPIDAFTYTGFAPLQAEKWLTVRNYETFVEAITTLGLPALISFDHDLGPRAYKTILQDSIDYESLDELTGYDCAKWLTNYCFDQNRRLPSFFVHSLNPVGKNNIMGLLNNYNKLFSE